MIDLNSCRSLAARPRAGCLIAVLAALGLLRCHAQPLQPEVLFNFSQGPANPHGSLVQGSDGNFYGTTTSGGANFNGTVFKMDTNGALTTLYLFTGGNDGASPYAGLVQGSDGNFYGTTYGGGSNGFGTVFKISTNGALSSLYSFTGGANGAYPYAALTQGSDGDFYGTTYGVGSYGNKYENGNGTVFKISTNGVLTTLYAFGKVTNASGEKLDGANPYGSVVQGSDGNLYGTTYHGGAYTKYGQDCGTVFKLGTNGVLTTLYSFTAGYDDSNPYAGLVQGSDGNFYGTTYGATFGDGTVFKISPNGVLTTLYSFTYGLHTGWNPQAPLVQGSDGNLYGTTQQGPYNGEGTVFKISTNGAVTNLFSFIDPNDGWFPNGLVQGADGNFYGTTQNRGPANNGTVFRISPDGGLSTIHVFTGAIDGGAASTLEQGLDGNFYGTTPSGGTNGGGGTVFKINTNGALTSLYSFTGTNDGGFPYAPLVQGSDGNFYGTTYDGGTNGGYGTVFKVNTNGALTSLYSFTGGNDGGNPNAGLVQGSDGNFYGTTAGGGTNGDNGTVFKINAYGALTSLYSFTGTNDGRGPNAGLVQGSDGNFYGTTVNGGAGHYGTVFKISTNGALTTLYSFTAGYDGGYPNAGLVQGSDGNFYGTTEIGGVGVGQYSQGYGTVFRISTNGALATLYAFTGGNDGANPPGGLVQGGDGNLYGTTPGNYPNGTNYGTVFQLTTNGSLATLFSFAGTNGASPRTDLTLGRDGNFYGTTFAGGSYGLGAIFRVSPQKPLIVGQPQPASQVVLAGANVMINAQVFGALPLTYQWILNTTNLPGATNAELILTNLSLSESGNYALVVTNNLGSALSSNAVLTVVPTFVSTLRVTAISATGAMLRGEVTVGAEETLAWFEWGADTNYGQIAGVTNIPGGSGTVFFSDALSGLDANLIYHYRVVAWNSLGIVYGADQPFQVGLIPTAVTLGGIDISSNGATLIGTVNPQGPDTTAYFSWGPTSLSLSNRTPVTDLGSGVSPINVSIPISGLVTGRVYYCKIVASNYLGTVSGAVVGFPTGPWTQTTAPPIHNWDSVAASADGTKLVAVASDAGTGGPIYTSTNSGITWTQTSAPLGPWASVACSADGTQIVVAGGGINQFLGPIYRSSNSGATWAQTGAPSNSWSSVASSADGTKLVATDSGGERIYSSADSGATWTQTSAPSNYWSSVASSADGTKLVAVALSGQICTSTNSGATWVSTVTPYESWTHVSSSADGAILLAVAGGSYTTGPIYSSTDSGATWVDRLPLFNEQWIGSAVSADGTRMAAVALGGAIYTSTNSGATWFPSLVPNLDWNAVSSSADGAFLVASAGYPAAAGVYTWRITPAPQLNLAFSQGNLVPSWIIPSIPFGLQQNIDLTTTNWTAVTNLPVLNLTNLQNQVVLPLSAGKGFFQLKH